MQQFVMRLLLGIFTHKLCRRKWGRDRNKEEKEEKWRMKRVKRKAMGREGNEGRRRMGQQHTDVTFCVTSSYPVDGCRAPSRL